MRLISNFLSEPISICEGETVEIVIENQKLFRESVEDIKIQLNGEKGRMILSENNTPLDIKKNVELIENIALFDINTKSLLNKIYTKLEKTAMDEEHYYQSNELLGVIEKYIDGVSDDIGYSLDYSKLTIDSIIKAASPRLLYDYEDSLEAITDYMSYVNDLERKNLFVFVNMRSYFSDVEMQRFIKTISSKGLKVLLVETLDRLKMDGSKKLIIDSDLCEI